MRTLALAALALTLLLFATPLVAEPGADVTRQAAAAGPSTGSSEPVPVPPPTEKAMQFYTSGNLLWVVSTLWGLAVPLLLLFTGVSARLRQAASRIGRGWFFTIAAFGVLFTLVTFILDLPLTYYSSYVRPHAYGLSEQTTAKWWSDSFKGLAIGCVFTALVLWVPYLLLRKSPRRWWLYTGLATIPLLTLVLLVTPIWIDPLFNDFGPMQDKDLEARILALADRAGIEGGRVFEVNKSVDTNMVNAYVTGIFNTKRIVLWDTILAKLDPDELVFVMGHEMGHYVLGHIWQLILLGSGLALFGLWVVHRTAGWMLARYRDRFGFSELSDVASLPLMGFLFTLVTLVVMPAALAVTRHIEHESDRFGLEITRGNHECGTAFVKLQQENLGIPRPGTLYKLWRASHPPLGERIDFCNEYTPWQRGEPLKYGGLIRGPGK